MLTVNRRGVLLGAAISVLSVAPARAQIFPPAGYATPAGTSPFGPDVYRERRQRVMGELKTGVAVLYGARKPETGGMVSAPFVQEENFAWLTGINDEPDAILILAPSEREWREVLLLPERDPERERWEIERLPLSQELEHRTGFNRVYRNNALGRIVTTLAARSKELRYLGALVGPDQPIPAELELYGKILSRIPGTHIVDDSALMVRLRLVKEPREIEQMRRAMAATERGHLAAMRAVRPGWTERKLKEMMEAEFRAGGGQGLSYDSIVAAGRNAASLHYGGGDGPIHAGDLILIDAAASVGGYATDVTRTFPVDGKFTPEQRALYELVLEAQNAAAAKLKAGVFFEDLSETAKAVFRKAGRIDDFYHGLGHFVGLSVHDVGDLTKPLPAGAVITIEPGLYVQSANYGIRIEDDYLVTQNAAERLSAGVPRTVAEIESFMANGR